MKTRQHHPEIIAPPSSTETTCRVGMEELMGWNRATIGFITSYLKSCRLLTYGSIGLHFLKRPYRWAIRLHPFSLLRRVGIPFVSLHDTDDRQNLITAIYYHPLQYLVVWLSSIMFKGSVFIAHSPLWGQRRISRIHNIGVADATAHREGVNSKT